MKQRDPGLLLQSAPFLRSGLTTPGLMGEVILALVPVIMAAVWFFGLSALLILVASTAGAVLTEWFFSPSPRGRSLKDNSAVLTGLLLGLCLPPGMALWMAFVGGVAAIGLGKLIFGGLGQNFFNPALLGRAFLQAAFPTAITTWSEHGSLADFATIRPSNFASPLMQAPPPVAIAVDAVSTATPLGMMKFQEHVTQLGQLLMGNTAGSLGETCGIAIILVGIIMALRRTLDWRIPLSIIACVGVFSAALWMFDSQSYPPPWFMISSGGLLFGAVYMATDPVTSPITPRGACIFGVGIGLLVVLIRLWGGLPEGVMYSILLMNAATPLIEKISKTRPFGRGRAVA